MPSWKSTLCNVTVFLLLVSPKAVIAQSCYAPERPFVPSDPQDVREFRDLIGRDFETYIADIQSYFRCLEKERVRAFEEAREVSDEYGRFLEIASQ